MRSLYLLLMICQIAAGSPGVTFGPAAIVGSIFACCVFVGIAAVVASTVLRKDTKSKLAELEAGIPAFQKTDEPTIDVAALKRKAQEKQEAE